jgi:DnaJ-class molecular chaperone
MKKKRKDKIKFGWWQLCPLCNGSGNVQNQYLNLTAVIKIPCTVCHGSGAIQRPVLNKQP